VDRQGHPVTDSSKASSGGDARKAGLAPPLPGRDSIDVATLMRIRSLELRARGVVEGLWRGLHRSPYHGFSVEFSEYRAYSPGDDVRFLDWRLYARTDRDYVKKFEDETNLRCHLIHDHSRSMAYGSRRWSKADYAATLAATLASFLFAQGDAVGLTTFAAEVHEHLPARNRPGHLRRLLAALERPAEGRATAVGRALEHAAALLRRRGMVVLLSDLLVPLPECERPLAALKAAGHEVVVFQLLDPTERTLDLPGPTLLRDLESDQVLHVDPGVARSGYLRALEGHLAELKALCARLGVDRHLFLTDRPLESALLEFLGERTQRRRRRR
jgi:uncharacterized protein (DUF58 family)